MRPRVYPKDPCKLLVEIYTVLYPVVRRSVALLHAVDDINRQAKTRNPSFRSVLRGWGPLAHHHRVARRNRTPGLHPEVQRGGKGDDGVFDQLVRIRQEVERNAELLAKGHGEWPVIVVPRELHWAAAVICLASCARAGHSITSGRAGVPRRAVSVARPAVCAHLLLETKAPGLGTSRGCCPPAR